MKKRGLLISLAVFLIFVDLVTSTSHEEEVKVSIILLGIIVSSVILIALLLMALYGKILTKEDKEQYNFRNLFFPKFSGKTIPEKVSLVIINPLFWLFELLLGIFNLYLLTSEMQLVPYLTSTMVYGVLLSVLSPVIAIFIAWITDYYKREPWRFVFSMFMWGIGASLFSLFLIAGTKTFLGMGDFLSTLIFIPFWSELTKGLGIMFLSANQEVNDTHDGLLYGFVIGAGFSIAQSIFYMFSTIGLYEFDPTFWLLGIAIGSIGAALVQGSFTAVIGGFIGILKMFERTKDKSYLGFVPGVIIAISLHSFFNYMSASFGDLQYLIASPTFIFALLVVILIIALISTRYRRKIENGY